MTQTPIPYFGGKQILAPWIASMLPEHEHYVEPFCGGLSVLLAKPPCRMETVNDLDQRLMVWWRVLRDRPEDLIRVCSLTPHSREEYALAMEDAPDDLEQARRVWIRLSQSRGGQLRGAGWKRRIDPSSRRAVSADLRDQVQRMAWVAERLSSVTLECKPALDLIGEYGAHSSCLLYVDPPYLGATRNPTSRYSQEMTGEEDHRELASALADCHATVVVSGYPSPLYFDLYRSWHFVTRQVSTGNGGGRRERTEVLWSNRLLGTPSRARPPIKGRSLK